MIRRWKVEYSELKQGDWADFMQTAQECALGWSFKEVGDSFDGWRSGHPDIDGIRDLDLLDLLSLGECKMPYVEVDEALAFKPDDYRTIDVSSPVSSEAYIATERVIDLACIWNAHRARNGRSTIALPKHGYDRNVVKALLNQVAEDNGIVYEIKAYLSGVPLADVLAGYEKHADPDDMWGISRWQIPYRKRKADSV